MTGCEAQPVARDRRRWSQFSLRTLLILTTVCAVVCALLAHKWRIEQERRLIRQEIRRLGGEAGWKTAPWWRSEVTVAVFTPDDFFHAQRSWKGDGITDADLSQLEPRLQSVRYLSLAGSEVTDKSLGAIGNMRELRGLDLTSTAVTDAGLRHLGHLPRLEELRLRGAGIPDRSISWFARCFVRKDFKVPVVSRVTDDALIHLGRVSTLRKLDLGMTDVTDAGLSHLESLSRLEELGLAGTLITDNGLAHLQRLPRLREIDLQGTRISDAGLESLFALSSLEVLYIAETGVTDDGAKRLQHALPNCKILK